LLAEGTTQAFVEYSVHVFLELSKADTYLNLGGKYDFLFSLVVLVLECILPN
jgi:hypothetical protein